MKEKYYSLKPILSKECYYNLIIGERSNGKTYSVLKYGLEQFVRSGKQMAIVRRFQDDFIGTRGLTMFASLVNNNEIFKATNGEWSDVYYYGSRWYLSRYDESGKRETMDKPFAFGFSLSSMEHDKSTSYPNITTICFDEFITRKIYLPDEFIIFLNVLSTIIRDRNDVKIFMLGNTVNQYCPYFAEMGLKHIKNMKMGTIDVYSYGDSKLKVAVEYCKPNAKGKDSDFYFAFDNPKLGMITGGIWEIEIYPHCPTKYKPKNIIFTYYIIFDTDILQCEVVYIDDLYFTFVHRKKGLIKYPDTDIVFSTEFTARPNYYRKITKPTNELTKRIAEFFIRDKVFYSDNETGEIMRNYLLWCGKDV